MISRRFNAALVRYADGHVFVDRSGSDPTREMFLSMPGVKYRENAVGIADSILRASSTTRETVAYEGLALKHGQVPGHNYQLQKLVNGKYLVSFSATLTDDGYASIVPEFDDPIDIQLDALLRRIERATSGAASEYGLPVTSRESTGRTVDTSPPSLSMSGELVVDDEEDENISPVWSVPRPWWCSWIEVSLRKSGSTRTRVVLLHKNAPPSDTASVVAQCIVYPGRRKNLAVVNRGWLAGEDLYLAMVEGGEGARDLTVALRGVMV